MIATTLTDPVGGGAVAPFYSKTLKHKLQAAVLVLCWYFCNLNKIAIVQKRKYYFNFNSQNICN